jgi:hypothetical protein
MEKKKKFDKGTCITIGITALISSVLIILILIEINKNNTKSTYSSTSSNISLEEAVSNYSQYYKDDRQKITIIDFSSMSQDKIKEWCEQNKITYVFTTEYSDLIEKGGFIKQSVKSGDYVYEGGNINIVYSLGKKPTKEETNALKKAQSYATTMHMSKQGVYEQLISEYGEGFTTEAAQYAIDNLNVDWNANALKKAKSYQDNMNMSKKAIYQQLISSYGEQFTKEEAQYAIDHLDD